MAESIRQIVSLFLCLNHLLADCVPLQTTFTHPFVGFFLFPHGGIILSPQNYDFSDDAARNGTREESIGLHNAMRSAAKALVETKPDLVILSSPHGFYLEDHYTIVANPSMSGNAGWTWSNFSAKFNIAKPASNDFWRYLREKGNPVEILTFGIGASEMPLAWGEVIPWYFVTQAADEHGLPLPPVIYIGQPPSDKIEQAMKIGADIVDFFQTYLGTLRIAVLISGDQSHYHSNDPRAPYPFNENSVIFDGFIQQYGKLDLTPKTQKKSNELLLEKAKSVHDNAGTCAYGGMLMAHGIMSELVKNGVSLKAKYYYYAAPTYFGMMVTSWIPQQ